jgi:hypothetical protein
MLIFLTGRPCWISAPRCSRGTPFKVRAVTLGSLPGSQTTPNIERCEGKAKKKYFESAQSGEGLGGLFYHKTAFEDCGKDNPSFKKCLSQKERDLNKA